MNSLTDQQLLREYTGRRSEAAFAELVQRHVDFVYSAALRMVRDAPLAEDVTQGVFVALAQNAPQLTDHLALPGWLHCTAQNLAAKAVRSDVRRRAREQEAATMNELLSAEPDAVWEHIAPHLDAALGELVEADRYALLLRFFKNHDFRTIGVALGVSDDAAQKRVSRALERLRAEFHRRGVTTTAVALSAAVSANAVQAAPVGLAVTISTAAALAGTSIATAATATAIKTIAMTTLQKALIGATLAAAIATGIYEARQASTLRTQVQTLQQQQADQIQQQTRERDDMASKLTALRDDNERLDRNPAELLRLRGELTRLRNTPRSSMELQGADGKMESLVKSWLARVNNLKQRLEQTPGAKIPELQFLDEADWINVAKGEFKTDADYRKALAVLRMEGTTRFVAWKVKEALTEYAEANNGQFPSDVSQLQPYLKTPEEGAILQRYQVIPAIYLGDDASYVGDWAITQKAAVDEENDVRIAIGPKGIVNSHRTETDGALDSLISAFAAANHGRRPTGIYDLQPYITTPADEAAFRKRIIFDPSMRSPAAVPVYR